MGKVTLKVFLLIVMTDINESIAQLFLKKGLVNTGVTSVTFQNMAEFFLKVFSSPLVWLGILVFLVNLLLWLTVLSRVDLSVASPVGSTSYIFVPILAVCFLHETINPLRWAGIVLIIAGIHFVSRSTHTKEDGGT
ncbi:MAG: EamA family transporter [Candidatus Omnitrophota bacterium]